MSSKRTQPPWSVGSVSEGPQLKLYNSLTRQKELFVPKKGRRVLWYSCGPTVYDAAHMGHARSYISFDILRRILSDYFGYNVLYVMNITDVDDKIIKRARQKYLFKKYMSENRSLGQLLNDTQNAISLLVAKAKATADNDVKTMLLNLHNTITNAVAKLDAAVKQNDVDSISKSKEELLLVTKDTLSDWLDKKFGETITDNSIFSELPAYWESEFHKDMDSLNVMRPNVLTRVSEYIPEIITYIERIIANGLAYESNGSVYFDVPSFDNVPSHYYAKLVPEAFGDSESLQSGEGDLGEMGEKRSPTDFALWKSAKPGEPWWNSPWGRGRPGWHIECSVMASEICGDTLDIHTGGVDLKFPHHDNELAQAEAYFDNDCWVRYFLHSGHLTISGCKMSKSLKNFVSIADALKKHSARQLRLAFLLHSWRDTLDYSDNTMDMAVSYEKMINEFFLTVKDICHSIGSSTNHEVFRKWTANELTLNRSFTKMKREVHAALCDNIDTRTALESIRDCITKANVYLSKPEANHMLLKDIAYFITRIMTIFGVISQPNNIGFPVGNADSGTDVESIAMPFLRILGQFRDEVRGQARDLKIHSILNICDNLRDNTLPDVGVRLEDREGRPCAVKLMDKETLIREREAKKNLEDEKERKKRQMEALQNEREALKRVPPEEMFLSMKDKYSAFDSQGLPTHDAEGKELSKGQQKKLQKSQQLQRKKYTDYMDSIKTS